MTNLISFLIKHAQGADAARSSEDRPAMRRPDACNLRSQSLVLLAALIFGFMAMGLGSNAASASDQDPELTDREGNVFTFEAGSVSKNAVSIPAGVTEIMKLKGRIYAMTSSGHWLRFSSGSKSFITVSANKSIVHLNRYAHQRCGTSDGEECIVAPGAVAASNSPTPNSNCTITIPENPFTAKGLATPYELSATDPSVGPCNETNAAQSAFVQAAIFDPATSSISIYNPLVIDRGTKPASVPVVPTLPANAIVAIWFGFNGDNLIQQDTNHGGTLVDSKCVNGTPGSPFSQFSYCNAPAFFEAANNAIQSGALVVPPLSAAKDAMTCPTVRDFYIVDQDQSDNLPTTYLITGNGLLAQNSVENLKKFPNATVLGNPSDNGLVDRFIDVSLSCSPWTVTDLSNPGQMAAALPLDELQAKAYQAAPVALIPAGDPMVTIDASIEGTGEQEYSLTKLNAYRVGVDQPVAADIEAADTAQYCMNMLRIAPARLTLDEGYLSGPSPVAGANSLFTFMMQRFSQSYQNLDCAGLLNLPDPTVLHTDRNGNVTAAAFNQAILRTDLNAIANK